MTTINIDSSLVTHRNAEYTITTSLSDHYIIINLSNNVSYACYEGQFDNSAFQLSFDNVTIFKLINKCFANLVDPTCNTTYKVNISLAGKVERMVIDFNCAVEGFLTVVFSLRIMEKTVSGDNGVHAELNRQKYLVSELTERIAEMDRVKQETANTIATQQHTIAILNKRVVEITKENTEIISRQMSIIDNFRDIQLFSPEETQRNVDWFPGEIRHYARESIKKYGWNIRIGNINKARSCNRGGYQITVYTDTKLIIFIDQSGRCSRCSATFNLDNESFAIAPGQFMPEILFDKWGNEGKLSKIYIHPQVYTDYLVGCGEREITRLFTTKYAK